MGVLEYLKMMRLALGKRGGEDRFGLSGDDHFRLLGAALLFAAKLTAFYSNPQSATR